MHYFDHSATTPLHPRVKQLMDEVGRIHFGNPSSIHSSGQKAKALIEKARGQMAKSIGCSSNEIIFTGGGTEANNLVLWNLIHEDKKHVVTSSIEHPAILATLDHLQDLGVAYSEVGVDKYGIVDPSEIEGSITEDTGLITIMMANNEVGTIQPIKEISEIAKKHNIPFHSDAVQALGKFPIDAKDLGVDMMSFSAHKFYGPKGVGVLYFKKGTSLKPHIIGGSQERSLRAGTQNTVGIVGMGLAAEIAAENLERSQLYLNDLKGSFMDQLRSVCNDVVFNQHSTECIPGLVSVTFPGVRSDLLMIHLDRRNVAVSSGSACSSGDIKPSKVLTSMGIADDLNICTLRISFGSGNTQYDTSLLVDAISESLKLIRPAA